MGTPIDPEVDVAAIAQHFKLTGGNILSIAVSAAFLTTEPRQNIGLHHLLQATCGKFQKMGRLIQ
jgi:hypothetical protein